MLCSREFLAQLLCAAKLPSVQCAMPFFSLLDTMTSSNDLLHPFAESRILEEWKPGKKACVELRGVRLTETIWTFKASNSRTQRGLVQNAWPCQQLNWAGSRNEKHVGILASTKHISNPCLQNVGDGQLLLGLTASSRKNAKERTSHARGVVDV